MPFSLEALYRIAERHGLSGEPKLLPNGGMVNQAWEIGDAIVRICRIPDARDEAAREVAVVPKVIEAGMRVPRLIGYGLDEELTPLPYTVYEKAKGELMGYCDFGPEKLSGTYREIGREIARLGRVEVTDDLRKLLRKGEMLQPWKTLSKALARRKLDLEVGNDIGKWLDFMEPKIGKPSIETMIHMDIHPWNVFVDPDKDELAAIIDWGDASWGDPALEFASMPMQAMPEMIEGYVEEGGPVDEAFVARALYAGVSLSLWEIRALPVADFDRRWWRMPMNGWDGIKEMMEKHWPEHLG